MHPPPPSLPMPSFKRVCHNVIIFFFVPFPSETANETASKVARTSPEKQERLHYHSFQQPLSKVLVLVFSVQLCRRKRDSVLPCGIGYLFALEKIIVSLKKNRSRYFISVKNMRMFRFPALSGPPCREIHSFGPFMLSNEIIRPPYPPPLAKPTVYIIYIIVCFYTIVTRTTRADIYR